MPKYCEKHKKNKNRISNLCTDCEREELNQDIKIINNQTFSIIKKDEIILKLLESEVQELKDKLEFKCTCWNNELKIKDSKIESLKKENIELRKWYPDKSILQKRTD